MTRAAAYCRVSLEDQAEKYGLPSQLRGIQELATARGYQIPDDLIFTDDGYTGADLDRPALGKLRSLVRARALDLIITYDTDRLSRKVGHFALLQEECEKYNVDLCFATTPDTQRTPEHQMLLQMKGVFAEYERAKINERTLRGRREKARQGFIVGGRVPYGYDYIGKSQGERGRLVVNDQEAGVVRQIFAWSSAGISLREITSRLNEQCISSKLRIKWGQSSVRRLLHNEVYIGQAHYNKNRRKEPDSPDPSRRNKKTCLRLRERSEWIPISVPAIIDRELFDQVAARLQKNQEVFRGRPARAYLLRGLIFCSCGRRFGACPNKGELYYRCSGRDRVRGNGCKAPLISAPKIERAIWASVVGLFTDAEHLRDVISRNIAEFSPSVLNARTLDIEAALAKLKRTEFRAMQSMLDSELGEHYEAFRQKLKAATQQRSRIERELSQLSSSQARSCQVLDSVEAICNSVKTALVGLDESGKREFLVRLVDRIEYAGGKATVECCLPNSGQRFGDRVNYQITAEVSVA